MSRPTTPLLLTLPLVFLVACAGATPPPEAASVGQTFTDAMKLMCNVDALAGLSAEEDPLAIGQARTAWLTDHVENPDGIELRTLVSVKGADEQAKVLRTRAKEVGIEACPLADSLEKNSAGGLSP